MTFERRRTKVTNKKKTNSSYLLFHGYALYHMNRTSVTNKRISNAAFFFFFAVCLHFSICLLLMCPLAVASFYVYVISTHICTHTHTPILCPYILVHNTHASNASCYLFVEMNVYILSKRRNKWNKMCSKNTHVQ